MKQWKPRDWVALVLAVSVASVIIMAGVFRFFTDEAFDIERAKVVAGLMGAIIAILAAYISGSTHRKDDDD